MRMKKVLILAAVAAIAATACNKTYEVNPTPGVPIGFGTWTETLTKAEARVQGTSQFLAGDTFAVYGYKEGTSAAPSAIATVFDKDVVTASGSGTLTWDYPNHRFWDKNYNQYVFYAVSPSAVGLAATVSPTTGAITTADITFSGKDYDILIADKYTVAKADYNSLVALNFRHAAALLDVKVKKAPTLTNAVVTVSAFSLENIEDNGVLTIATSDYAPAITLAASNWGADNGTLKNYLPADGVTPVYGDDAGVIATEHKKTISGDTAFDPANTTANTTPANSTDLITSLVVKPQVFSTAKNDASSQKLTITYQITTTDANSNTSVSEYTSTLWLSDFDIVDNSEQTTDTKVASWQPGKHYVFYLTLDANPIVFGNVSITDWTSANGYHYLVN